MQITIKGAASFLQLTALALALASTFAFGIGQVFGIVSHLYIPPAFFFGSGSESECGVVWCGLQIKSSATAPLMAAACEVSKIIP